MNLQTTLHLLTSTKHLAASFISPRTIDSPDLSLLYSVLSCSFSSQSALWFILSSLKKWVLNQSSYTLNLSRETTQRNVYGTIVNYQSPCCLWFFPLCVFFWLCASPDSSDQCFSWIDNPSNYMYVWYLFMFPPFYSLYFSIDGNGMPSHKNQRSGQHKQIGILSNLMHEDLRIKGYLNLL